jgi:hypothetical protein
MGGAASLSNRVHPANPVENILAFGRDTSLYF